MPLAAGLRLDSLGNLQRSPDLLAGFKGRGRKGKVKEGREGDGEKEGEG